MFYDKSGWAARVREMFLDRDYGVAGATLGRYFSTFSLSSFLSLMQEKRQKKIKPSRMAFPYRVREGEGRRKELLLFIRLSLMYPANLAGVPDALIFF